MLPSHYPSVVLSSWQSAVGKMTRRPDPLSEEAERPPLVLDDERVVAANEAAFAQDQAKKGARVGAPASLVQRLARASLDLGLALVDADPDRIIAAKAGFMQFGNHDPFWLECIAEFVEHYTLTRHGAVPYIKYRTLTDCILPPGTLPSRCRIAVLGDWGTGDARAQALLEDVARQSPDILIHLGDIYYSCTALEANAFYNNVTRLFPLGGEHARVFTLCGNHDMYSGGGPYYALLRRLGQPASFFCLRNPHWQVLAADTGYNDFNPFKDAETVTWIRDRDEGDTYSELDWHRDKLVNAGSRRTILMTHHPLFTRNSSIAGRAVNCRLMAQFGDYLPDVALWLWGHEHNLLIYEPFEKLGKGRCVGASAVPVWTAEDITSVSPELAGQSVPGLVRRGGDSPRLLPQASGDFYSLAYTMIDLDGHAARATYREFDPSSGAGRVVFTEAL